MGKKIIHAIAFTFNITNAPHVKSILEVVIDIVLKDATNDNCNINLCYMINHNNYVQSLKVLLELINFKVLKNHTCELRKEGK